MFGTRKLIFTLYRKERKLMANLIIGNGEDLRALVDSLFTLRDPEKEAALSDEEREALRRKREEEIRLL